jgi:hypothetical protein
MRRWVALLGAAAWGGAQAACPLAAADGTLVSEGPLQLAWRAEPAPIVAGQPFVLWISTCPAGAQLRAVDATMPEHRHGMNYRVKLAPQGAGRWRAEGLLWHMSGRWELRFDVEQGGRTQSLRHSVVLP